MLSEQQRAGKAFTRSDWFFLTLGVRTCISQCSPVSLSAALSERRNVGIWQGPGFPQAPLPATAPWGGPWSPGAGSGRGAGGHREEASRLALHQGCTSTCGLQLQRVTACLDDGPPRTAPTSRVSLPEQLLACQKFWAKGIFYLGGFHCSNTSLWFSRKRTTRWSFLPLSSRGWPTLFVIISWLVCLQNK